MSGLALFGQRHSAGGMLCLLEITRWSSILTFHDRQTRSTPARPTSSRCRRPTFHPRVPISCRRCRGGRISREHADPARRARRRLLVGLYVGAQPARVGQSATPRGSRITGGMSPPATHPLKMAWQGDPDAGLPIASRFRYEKTSPGTRRFRLAPRSRLGGPCAAQLWFPHR